MSNQRVLTYRLSRNHPDKAVFTKQAIESRRLYNSLNAVAREAHAYYRNKDADTHISKQLDLLDWTHSNPYLNSYGSYEKIRKQVERTQGISLPQKIAQHVARNLASNWTSYYGLLKSGHKVNPPRFKQEYNTVHYTIQALSKRQLRDRIILPTGWGTGVRLPEHVTPTQVQAARLSFKNGSHWLEVIYKKIDNPPVLTEGVTAAIDLGVNNLATVVFSDGRTPLIINGRPIKSVNQYANKKAASIRSQLDKERELIYSKMKKQYGALLRNRSLLSPLVWINSGANGTGRLIITFTRQVHNSSQHS